MSVQGGETLPVAISDLERQKQNNEDILAAIEASLTNLEGMPFDGQDELEQQKAITVRHIGWLAAEITMHQ